MEKETKIYRVTIYYHSYAEFEVEAESESEAICKAEQEDGTNQLMENLCYADYTSAEIISEDEKANEITSYVNDLKKRMKYGIVEFSFVKKDGSIRKAKGTLSDEIIPKQEDSERKGERKENPSIFTYYDCEKQAWRSFKVENILIP